MEQVLVGGLLFVVLLSLLASGIWVAFSLMIVGYLGIALFSSAPVGQVMATSVWSASNNWALAALPMFIWMGEILFRTRLAEDLFAGLAPWMGRLPGRLLHVNILGCGIFAAVSGSSAATCATVGKMSLPELKKRGYDERLAIGTLAGSGTLGLLIPPSIILIVYGVATEESIARLFVAGVLPGLMLVVLFMSYVGIWSLISPSRVPPPDAAMSLREKLWNARRLIPVVALIVGVIGSIYMGLASPTDAAAVGVVLALLLAWASGTLNRRTFVDSLMGATRTSCMIAFILAGAAFLTSAMGFTGIPRELARWIGEMGLSPYALLAALTVFFIVLGCFLDGISVVVLTTAIILPMVEAAGIDRIWFGIYVVLVVEMSQITPPVGFNLFVIQGLTGRNIFQVAYAALPFFLLLLAGVVLTVAFPEIATWLPSRMAAQ
ncbi:MAG: TRAP transporter large permease subunit [Rhodovibrionaceae bacterium]|nr:TRAP transporter large permease subunit [Rhodovibrionaceae bacterium]